MWCDVQQNTDEWLNLRLGKITSSNQSKIMANYSKAFGNPAVEYAQKIALEIVTGKLDETYNYTNKYMERGNELEPLAIMRYEEETFNVVKNGGFYILEDENKIKIGDSNDGNVGDNGCVEVKSVIPKTQWQRIKKGGIDTAYKWQIQSHIWIGNKQWCDFISYCPEMSTNKQILITRVDRDDEMIEMLVNRNNLFRKEVEKHIKLLKD